MAQKGVPSLRCLRALRSIALSDGHRCYSTPPTASKQPPPPRPRPQPPSPQIPARIAADYQPGFRKRAKSDDDAEHIPQPLTRPIGMSSPPQPGENMGLDNRTLSQRRDDFVDFDKHMERRRTMTKQISKPYFRDWSNLRFHRGKIFKANERLFRADLSLWFPNFFGKTLSKEAEHIKDETGGWRKDGYKGLGRDTCEVMEGKVSVVSIVSSTWAQAQVDTFVSEEQNPELYEVLRENTGVAQRVWINHEENTLRWWLLQAFRSNLRRQLSTDEQHRYFMVRRGVSEIMKESIGLLNEKVGYVYLVDPDCKIRWAGSADAEPAEREGMVKGLRRLIQEARLPRDQRRDSAQQLEYAVADIVEAPKAAGVGS
ncbi:Mitochondrial ATPase complex subunit ATP10 [Cercospora beticola]|uniref:Mitochondrial ATPase complex subunit ATP10 n=1 Tax=Cercospora beticola TaxID=122368 RepID=A0A2G5I8R7_CERBT|nr:Mitochondrial ATPase complex subunit ATP10 [Cercospora beticola]PIB01185.1 Mitochondrial ATPase complex subunit ATP10 [Cercospora beticola]WPA95503.1 hypothetical protein RHO25_000102 [Cercospora beticola]CAK1356277.1 unnamed protein product [Cercospora beticola]